MLDSRMFARPVVLNWLLKNLDCRLPLTLFPQSEMNASALLAVGFLLLAWSLNECVPPTTLQRYPDAVVRLRAVRASFLSAPGADAATVAQVRRNACL